MPKRWKFRLDNKDELRGYADLFPNAGYDLGLYLPVEGSKKAAKGECAAGINFLGCTIQPHRCVPSKASTDRLKEEINRSISASKMAIKLAVEGKKQLSPKLSRTATLDALSKKIYGWQKAFDFCTESKPFQMLDEAVTNSVSNYDAAVQRLVAKSDLSLRMQVIGIPSTKSMFISSSEERRMAIPRSQREN